MPKNRIIKPNLHWKSNTVGHFKNHEKGIEQLFIVSKCVKNNALFYNFQNLKYISIFDHREAESNFKF